jgi:hypothetical protein
MIERVVYGWRKSDEWELFKVRSVRVMVTVGLVAEQKSGKNG